MLTPVAGSEHCSNTCVQYVQQQKCNAVGGVPRVQRQDGADVSCVSARGGVVFFAVRPNVRSRLMPFLLRRTTLPAHRVRLQRSVCVRNEELTACDHGRRCVYRPPRLLLPHVVADRGSLAYAGSSFLTTCRTAALRRTFSLRLAAAVLIGGVCGVRCSLGRRPRR